MDQLLLLIEPGRSDAASDGVASALGAMRRAARQLGLHGGSLFDGERFMHLLEGPAGAVAEVRDLVGIDPAWREEVLWHGRADPRAVPCSGWVGGYASREDLDAVLHAAATMHGPAAVAAFRAVLAEADVA